MALIKILPPQSYLRECFTYDPKTGVLSWRHRPLSHFPDRRAYKIWNTRFAGIVAGNRTNHGYLSLSIDRTFFLAHRVIWKWMTGEEPPAQLDHRNRQRADDCWDNLRPATPKQNQQNQGVRRDNPLGVRGVTRPKRAPKRYEAQIAIDGKHVYLGRYKTLAEAKAAYDKAAKEAWGEYSGC